MKNINDLRETLFDSIELMKQGKLKANDLKAIGDAAQVIVNTAKVEADYIRATGHNPISAFIEAPQEDRPKLLERPKAPLSTQEAIFQKHGV